MNSIKVSSSEWFQNTPCMITISVKPLKVTLPSANFANAQPTLNENVFCQHHHHFFQNTTAMQTNQLDCLNALTHAIPSALLFTLGTTKQ